MKKYSKTNFLKQFSEVNRKKTTDLANKESERDSKRVENKKKIGKKDALVTSNRIKLEKEARMRRWHSLWMQFTCNTESFQWHCIHTHTHRLQKLPERNGQCENAKNLQFISNGEIEFFPEGYLNVIIKKFASLLLHFFFISSFWSSILVLLNFS